MKVKNIILASIVLSSAGVADMSNVEDLLNISSKENMFRCAGNECVSLDYTKELEDQVIKVGETHIIFNKNAHFDFVFDKKKIYGQADTSCNTSSDPDQTKEECINIALANLTSDSSSKMLKEMRSIFLKDISIEKNGTTAVIESLNIVLDEKLMSLGSKKGNIQPSDLEFDISVNMKAKGTPESIKADLQDNLPVLLPKSERMAILNNARVPLSLPIVKNINDKILTMYPLLVKALSSQKDLGIETGDLYISSKLGRNDSLVIKMKLVAKSPGYGDTEASISFSIRQISSVIQTLKLANISEDAGMMFLMSLSQSIDFDSVELTTNLKRMIEIDRNLSLSNAEYGKIKRDLLLSLNSPAFKEESKNLSILDLFIYDTLSLKNTKNYFSAKNLNKTPLMMLLMVFGKGNPQAITELLHIEKRFSD